MNIAKHLKYFFILPALLTLLSVVAIGVWGLKLGIDISGGSLLQIEYSGGRPPVEAVRAAVNDLGLGEVRVQPTGETGYILRQHNLTPEEKETLLRPLRNLGDMEERQFTSVGPTIGKELLAKGLISLGLVTLSIVLFIAFAFRHVSKPVASWKYGVVTILTLLFDVLVPVGVFAALGHFIGAEVDSLFIVALLAIMGISINDKIVVFDRIRENLMRADGRAGDFASVVNTSIRQTIARSINTSLTVVIVLLSLYLWGPESTRVFALTLMVGMIIGTYSSIFFASPLLVAWDRWSRRAK